MLCCRSTEPTSTSRPPGPLHMYCLGQKFPSRTNRMPPAFGSHTPANSRGPFLGGAEKSMHDNLSLVRPLDDDSRQVVGRRLALALSAMHIGKSVRADAAWQRRDLSVAARVVIRVRVPLPPPPPHPRQVGHRSHRRRRARRAAAATRGACTTTRAPPACSTTLCAPASWAAPRCTPSSPTSCRRRCRARGGSGAPASRA